MPRVNRTASGARSHHKGGATIKDVARKSGFSIATVSRTFNNAELVDEETRRIIRAVSDELRYAPSALARGLSTRRTEAIGLLLPDLFGEFFSEILRGSDQTAQLANYHLVVSSSHNNRQEIKSALTMMRGRVDGLVIMSPHIDAATLDETLPHSLPVVLVNSYLDRDEFDTITVDNYGGALAMTSHLVGHGHQRVAIIKGTADNIEAQERLRGYRDALAGAGIPHDGRMEVDGFFSESSGYEAAQYLISLTDRPSAIFAGNDAMAVGALSAMRDAGLRVPDDIALAGFDDVPIASYMSPSLTSVQVGIHDIGVRAVETVIDAVRNKPTHRQAQVRLETVLSLRGSCGCSPAQISYPSTTNPGRRSGTERPIVVHTTL
jgi:LacI family transcriptional regulator